MADISFIMTILEQVNIGYGAKPFEPGGGR